MNKTLLLSAVVTATVTGAAFAASVPVTDINAGQSKVAVEYSFAQHAEGNGGSNDGFGASLSTGLSDKLALQYEYSRANLDKGGDVKDHRLEAVYKVSKNVNLYGAGTYLRADGEHETGFQGGVIGHVPLADNLRGFAKVGFGNDIKQTYQIGATYDLTNDLGLNVYYQYDKYSVDGNDSDIKGLHAGLGYSF